MEGQPIIVKTGFGTALTGEEAAVLIASLLATVDAFKAEGMLPTGPLTLEQMEALGERLTNCHAIIVLEPPLDPRRN